MYCCFKLTFPFFSFLFILLILVLLRTSVEGEKTFRIGDFLFIDNIYTLLFGVSMPIYDNRPPTFPYTMDYKLTHDCMIPPCPNRAFPGVWEIPLVMWNDLKVSLTTFLSLILRD